MKCSISLSHHCHNSYFLSLNSFNLLTIFSRVSCALLLFFSISTCFRISHVVQIFIFFSLFSVMGGSKILIGVDYHKSSFISNLLAFLTL